MLKVQQRKLLKKCLLKRHRVYSIAPVKVDGAKKLDSAEELRNKKLDLIVTLGGDGTTLRTFRHVRNENTCTWD